MSKNKESSKYGSVDDRTYINMDEILKAWPHNYCLLPLNSTICVILGRLSRSNMTVYIEGLSFADNMCVIEANVELISWSMDAFIPVWS